MKAFAKCLRFQREDESDATVINPAFVETVRAQQRKRATPHLLAASFIAAAFLTYTFAFFGVDKDPLVLIFRILQLATLAMLMLTYAFSRLSPTFQKFLDVPLAVICFLFIMYNSMTYRRMRTLTSPAFDHVVIEAHEPSEEIDCILVSYLAVALICHLQLVSTKVGFCIAMLAPLTWTTQALALGTVLPDITQIAVVYFMMSLVAFLGQRRSQDILLSSQWQIYGLGNSRQLRAMSGMMTYLCDCVLTISSSFKLMEASPQLSAMLFQSASSATAGTDVTQFLATDLDVENFTKSLAQGLESDTPGAFPLCLKDSAGRSVPTHVYYCTFKDQEGQACFALGLVENQDGPARSAVSNLVVNHPSEDSSRFCSPYDGRCEGFESEESSESLESSATSRRQTLGQVLASSAEDGMTMTISIDGLVVVDTSPALRDFVGEAHLQNGEGPLQLSRCLGKSAARKLQRLLGDLTTKAMQINRQVGAVTLRLPRPAARGTEQFFRAASCRIAAINFFEESGEETVLLPVLSFKGRKEVIERPQRSGGRQMSPEDA
eukprot:gb/GFBE01047550.1/.p1 GENE.gb/GFBE01047550.1/~~gb/GFBE01047550.1/.p1  ORF type:complete len:549 (+),score=85.94 gb/GFBE01047550.1/:1-1647(+)